MNNLEFSALDPREHHSITAAKSPAERPLSASSSTAQLKGTKQSRSMEIMDKDDEKCQQHQDNGQEVDNQREITDSSANVSKLMVTFDGFTPVGKPFARPRYNDEDEDVGNVRSLIMCNPMSMNASSASLSPTCVSALARDEVVRSDSDFEEPSWTIQEFQEYLGMLELLQDVSSDAEGAEMCLSADCLGQMERLLTLLLPQGA